MVHAAGYDPRYLAGVERFNAGDYFAAHEDWEALWLEATADRRFYQSLIQAAVALYHWGNGNRTGADRLFAAGRDKAVPFRPRHLGLDVDAFWAAVEVVFAGGGPPRIVLDPPPEPLR